MPFFVFVNLHYYDQVKVLRECGRDAEVKETMVRHYATEYPFASWKDMIKKLRHFHHLNAAEKVKEKYVPESTSNEN